MCSPVPMNVIGLLVAATLEREGGRGREGGREGERERGRERVSVVCTNGSIYLRTQCSTSFGMSI